MLPEVPLPVVPVVPVLPGVVAEPEVLPLMPGDVLVSLLLAPDVPPLAVVAPLDMPVLGLVAVLPLPLEPEVPAESVPLCLLQPASARVMTAVARTMRSGDWVVFMRILSVGGKKKSYVVKK